MPSYSIAPTIPFQGYGIRRERRYATLSPNVMTDTRGVELGLAGNLQDKRPLTVINASAEFVRPACCAVKAFMLLD